jgi:site-specific DNA-methyltransferase (adenine-specific)/adenine-specific DNA-methyltransferase
MRKQMSLNENEKKELLRMIDAGEPLPEKWRGRLFPDSLRQQEFGKEYRLVYDGKMRREEVLAQTPAAPWQLVRQFCTERPHPDGWRNLLVWGDNLLALRELLVDQQGPNRFGTRDRIKLIYIDPPFATRQDFMKDKEKAYRDKVIGSQFIEFLRRRGEGSPFCRVCPEHAVHRRLRYAVRRKITCHSPFSLCNLFLSHIL